MWRENSVDLKLNRFYEMSARAVLSLLIIAILLAIVAGVGCTLYDLRLVFNQEFHGAFKQIMVDLLTVLAIIEVLRTALAYSTEGRVKVTYIIDTVIVTVLTEVMAFWYKEIDWQEVAMTISLVLSLALIRIVAVRFSPAGSRKEL
ncbi:phosphate-starvation-inducible PsiE family protein [Geomonas subterranea]|uniref:Phosphate-starvation-inducible PsiE family protein n=1 Tax=Geomonas subterranea TaxID=2847989 RepID=A0ABX8LQ90_9BACT|nr:phosphate-starvation-inducible PsiE family protein [Geomonas subterranea]QXE92759.1 phosphate-starvation-inducible PsiE family protein [Geomonas subterranea]QXM09137.1 phosphate-starvation-inducible PsiE family protein [Geomonas subterranea]